MFSQRKALVLVNREGVRWLEGGGLHDDAGEFILLSQSVRSINIHEHARLNAVMLETH